MSGIEKYMGKWNLISRIPAWYDSDCQNETAEYQLINESTILVRNICYADGLKIREKVGLGLVLSKDETELFVSFPEYPSKVRANYIIIDTDFNNYSLVGSDDKSGLWILSRNNQMRSELANELTLIARDMGYNVGEMVDTRNSIIL